MGEPWANPKVTLGGSWLRPFQQAGGPVSGQTVHRIYRDGRVSVPKDR